MASILAGITIVFAIAWCVTALLHRASAALRHLVWTCAFGAALALAPLRWQAPHHIVATAIPVSVMEPLAAGSAVFAAPSGHGTRLDWSTIVLAVWITGTMILLLRLLFNAIRLRAVVRSAEGRAPILTSSRVPGPLAAGLLRPVILLPESAGTWTRARRRAVLAHEAAHIRRRDPAILLAAHIATAVYWFHPLCWLAAARLRAESERACDDAALRTGLLPSGYATDLLDLARMFDTQLAIPMATTSHLESRVKSILDPLINRSFPARATWLAAIALTAALVAPLTTFTLRAQQQTGTATITGVVVDPTGAVVPNASAAVIDQSGTRETTITSATGSYTFANMAPGYYTVEVRAPGFAVFRQDNLALVSGGKLEANAHLTVGGLNERITVAAQGTPKPAAAVAAGNSGPIRVGGMVQAPALIQQVKPVYPGFLQAQGIEGTVLLSALISKQGIPTSLKVVKSPANDAFAMAAISAVEQWRYQPTLLNGEPNEVLTTIQVDFKLSPAAPEIDDRVIANVK
jgi:TonB family protein